MMNTSTDTETKSTALAFETTNKNQTWLEQRFPLLTTHGFDAALEQRLKEQGAAMSDVFEANRTIKWSVIVDARIEMEKLAVLALKPDYEGEKARAIVADFLLLNGPKQVDELASYCQERAALTILESAPVVLTQPLFDCMIDALTTRATLPETARILLLQALEVLIAKWRRMGMPARVKIWQVLLETLEREMLRPPHAQSTEFSKAILKLVARHPHRSLYPLLKVVAENHESLEIRELANQTLHVISESLQPAWDETRKDQLADLHSRARRLAALNEKQHDVGVCVQTIFNNTKGVPIESAFDPRAVELKTLLKHNHRAVRTAVCWALFGQGSFCELLDDFMDGITILADIAVNSTSPGPARDAIELANRLQEQFPEAKGRIDKANQQASKKFVGQQLLSIPPIKHSAQLSPHHTH